MAGFKITYEGDMKKKALIYMESQCPFCEVRNADVHVLMEGSKEVVDQEALQSMKASSRSQAKHQFHYKCKECGAEWNGNITDANYNVLE